MNELAALAVLAKALLVELPTLLRLVVRGDVRFLPEFVQSVSEGALLAEGALPKFPVSAEFSLELYFEVLFCA